MQPGTEHTPNKDPAPDIARLEALLLSAAVPEQERQVRRATTGTIVGAILFTLIGIGIFATPEVPVIVRAYLFFGLAIVFLVSISGSPFPLIRTGRNTLSLSQPELKTVLAGLANPTAVGMLIDAEVATSGERQIEIQTALTRLLPRAAEIEGRPWTEEQAARLYTHLDAFAKLTHYTSNPPGFSAYPLGGTWDRPKVVTEEFPELRDEYVAFLLAIIEALAVAGDAESVRHLEAVAEGQPRTEQVRTVQSDAWKALDRIHGRLEAEREGRTLLRPTQEPSDPLLRPTMNPGGSAPGSLLRPDSPPEEPNEARNEISA